LLPTRVIFETSRSPFFSSALLIDTLVFSKIDRIQPKKATVGDKEVEAELQVVLPMLEHFNKGFQSCHIASTKS
jgi:hypothetical protein